MSQNPAVSVYARIELLKEKAIQDAKRLPFELQAAFKAAASAAKIEIPISFDEKGLQTKLNTALANLKLPAMVVPVTFAPSGMPGAGGSPGGMPWGASSPNWSNYFAGIQNQLQAMTPTSSPNWSVLLANRGGGPGPGGGGGASHLFNPFSPRGLARLMGSGAAVYGALAATNFATGMIEANQISSHPERVLREFDQIGSRRDVTADPAMVRRAGEIAGIQGEKKVLETIESVPLLGTLARFVDALGGASKALDDQEHAVRQQIKLHEYGIEKADELKLRSAESTGDPRTILAAKQRAELQAAFGAENKAQAAADIANADEAYAARNWSADDPKAVKLREDAKTARAELDRQRSNRINLQKQHATESLHASAHEASSASTIQIAGLRADASGVAFGDQIGAMGLTNQVDISNIEKEFNKVIDTLPAGSQERARMVAQRDGEIAAARAAQGLEMSKALRGRDSSRADLRGAADELDARLGLDPDKAARIALQQRQRKRRDGIEATDRDALQLDAQLAGRETTDLDTRIARQQKLEWGNTAARAGSMTGKAGEAELRAGGQDFNASFAAAERSINEHVAQLRRESAAADSAAQATRLLIEANAAEAAGVRELAAIKKEHNREAERELRTSTDEAIHGNLLESGQVRAARDQAMEAQYQEERRKIMESNDPNKFEKLNALNMRMDARRAGVRHDDLVQDTHLSIRTRDLEAQAHGQHGVGEVLESEEEIKRMYQDAGDDREKRRGVQKFANAKRASILHNLRPQAHIYGLAEYHDALQLSIMNGQGNREAAALQQAIAGRAPVDPGGEDNGGGGKGGRELGAAAKALLDAAQIIKGAKAIAVIGSKR